MDGPSVGVVGLGRMGASVAGHLVGSGVRVRGFDRAASARETAAERGVELDEDAAAVAAGSDVVLTSLPSPEAFRAVYLGTDGLVEGVETDLVAVDLSTVDPDTTVAVAEAATEEGLTLVDAPVSGGPKDAAAGTLTLFVGGDPAVVENPPVAPVLELVSGRATRVGDVGAGQTAKLVNNAMSMGTLLLSMEAVSMGVDRGLDGEALYRALEHAGGASNQLKKRLPRVLNRNFEPGFTVSLARKDLGLALDAADGVNHPMPVTALVHQLYTRAAREGEADADVGAVAKLFEHGRPIEADDEVDESFAGY
jgi:3-hydroxyisobutyrate dehydrogenase-like beta-hydroxyacid dehydrogenase